MSVEKLNHYDVRQEHKLFTSFYNEVLQNILNTSYLGVYCYLSSLPHNWKINRHHLMKHFDIGREKLGKIMKWLSDNYLIEYSQDKNEDGQFCKQVIIIKNGKDFIDQIVNKKTIVDTHNTDLPVSGINRCTENPLSGETGHIYNKHKDKKEIEKIKKKNDRKKRDLIVEDQIVLPVYLNQELWKEFLQHRKSIKSPMSLLAQKKALTALDNYYMEGYDIDKIINNSIVNGWKGLFVDKQLKEESHGNAIKRAKELYQRTGKIDSKKFGYVDMAEILGGEQELCNYLFPQQEVRSQV